VLGAIKIAYRTRGRHTQPVDARRGAWCAALTLVVALTAAGCADSPAESGVHDATSPSFVIDEAPPQPSIGPSPLTPASYPPPPTESIDPRTPGAMFAWVANDYPGNPFIAGVTLTITNGVTPTQALRLLAPDARTPVESPAKALAWTLQQPDTGPTIYEYIEAVSRHGWTLIMEPNGYRATGLATLRRLSAHGSAVVIYNNVNALASFQYARDGQVLRYFDPLLGTNYQDGPPLPQESGIGFGSPDGDYIANSLVLAFRLTGVRIQKLDLADANYSVAVGVAN
jgi:hypothetical protein